MNAVPQDAKAANSGFKRGSYIGPWKELSGQTSLLRVKDEKTYLAQFEGEADWRVQDEFKLRHPYTGEFLCYGWHEFPVEHFKEIVNEDIR